jgi:DNA-binding protein Fis
LCGNISKAATRMGLARRNLHKKIRKFGLKSG